MLITEWHNIIMQGICFYTKNIQSFINLNIKRNKLKNIPIVAYNFKYEKAMHSK